MAALIRISRGFPHPPPPRSLLPKEQPLFEEMEPELMPLGVEDDEEEKKCVEYVGGSTHIGHAFLSVLEEACQKSQKGGKPR